MTDTSTFADIFQDLRKILSGHTASLHCVHDDPGNYYLDTRHIMKNGKPLFFGAVQIKKRYVSFHLMPVYVHPELLESVSPALAGRMQGKSCFNFQKRDAALFKELASLTAAGFKTYKSANYV